MSNEKIIFPVIKQFNDDINNNHFVFSRGTKTVEIINAKLELDPMQPVMDFAVKKTNEEYCKKEIAWYESQSLKIKGYVDDIAIWQQVADKYGKVNSNYGWCIYSKENHAQYSYCLKALKEDTETRQAVMIYNRPSMHKEWNANGMKDFMCTMYQHFFIRQGKLLSIYNIRSNDFVFGFFNDFYWSCYVYQKFLLDLKKTYSALKPGIIYWNANSLHAYERHFDMIKNIYEHRRFYL